MTMPMIPAERKPPSELPAPTAPCTEPTRLVGNRSIGNVVALMPPYCTTPAQAAKMVGALAEAIARELG